MSAQTPVTLKLHELDTVLIAVADVAKGTDVGGVTTTSGIPRGHKIATQSIPKGQPVRRYGQIIGQATTDIAPGDHVHSHNLGMGEHQQDYAHATETARLPIDAQGREFMGYHRSTGRVGTRNYIGILTTVNCSGTVARLVAEEVAKSGDLAGFENVDGIVPIVHGTGCGMNSSGDGYDALFRTLSGYAQHPNFAGILMIGLGCEVMQVAELAGQQPIGPDGPIRYMTIQQTGGTKATIAKAAAQVRELAQLANQCTRAPAPISELTIGLQCGGSDGYSGVTANPALGYASDMLVGAGGTTILSETPEIYGAEHLLTRRAKSVAVGEKLIERIKWWEDYCARNNGDMDNNPSPGNKRGGLTTILEKSLGAVAKGGAAPVDDIYLYGEQIRGKGFVFMDSPGYDPASVTGQIASGANLIIFTTGRGSVSGYQPTPGIKLATNSDMYARLEPDMDVNCGDILTGDMTIQQKGAEILDLAIAVASGELTKSEAQGFGAVEFVPWVPGAVM